MKNKNIKRIQYKWFIVALVFSSFAFIGVEDILFKVPQGWSKPTYDFNQNPLVSEKVELGRRLFYEPLLSKDNSISCASCHQSHLAFAHIDHELSHGIGDKIGIRNAPALMNLAWAKSFMWDGAINHLDMQSLAPITHPDEMGETLENVVIKLQKTKSYPAFFQKAYGDSLVTGERILKTLSQFMLTLVSADAKFDKVMRQEATFNEYEAAGYKLFKTHCNSCHTAPLFTNNAFENNGLEPDTTLNDFGRIRITRQKSDSLKFKVPTLRNVEVTYPYMHDGRIKNLPMVLFHYTGGVHQSPTLSKQLSKKMQLTEDEKVNLIAFLKTLTDEIFLHNPNFQYAK
jgi:cytochrome c peroxidase